MSRDDATRRRSPLAAAHEALGARWMDWEGCQVPARYGPLAAEHAALAAGRALVDRSCAEALEVAGEDRRRFLNGYLTCDVLGLPEGESAYGFLTNAQGRILSDVTVLSLPGRFLLELPPGRAQEVASHLARYVIADRVEIRPWGGVPLTLFGAGAQKAAGAAEWVPDGSGERGAAPGTLWGRPIVADRRPLWGFSSLTLWADPEESEDLWARLLEAGRPEGLQAVGLEALEIHRVERGAPRFGPDFGIETFPQETGLEEEAVSYTKGCYLGQEVVARIHYRGKVNRLLCGLLLDRPAPTGSEILFDGRPLGSLGSVVGSVALGRPVALAVLHRRGAEPGTRLEIAGGAGAEVVALPFVAP